MSLHHQFTVESKVSHTAAGGLSISKTPFSIEDILFQNNNNLLKANNGQMQKCNSENNEVTKKSAGSYSEKYHNLGTNANGLKTSEISSANLAANNNDEDYRKSVQSDR